ncbi:phage tail domain-containing protein [Streptomyces werraensis]|uniref:phage tail domain-containing protein n=1 Tax=Streptomyces werraensis TaxID=68284 RepID=UPI0037013EE5
MPIPVKPVNPVNDTGPSSRVSVPVPENWQHTYVSIRGANGQGEEIPLTGLKNGSWPAIVLQPGVSGLDLPPFELHADDSPNLDGSSFRSARAAARQILLPVFVYGIDRKTLRQFKRKLANSLNPKAGYCILTFIEQDGIPRRLQCYYAGGMEGNESVDAAGFKWISYGIQLVAMDPWFYGDTEVAAKWSFGSAQPFLGNPFLPLRLSSGTPAVESIEVTNPGDIEAWPIWTITGPLKSFEFTGPDGSKFGVPAQAGGADALPAGRTLTIDTRPGYKTVLDDQGKNYFPLMNPAPALWSVPPGTSTVKTNLVAGSGTPSVAVRLVPRYETY